MNKNISIRLLVIVMSLALMTVVIVQWFWITNAVTVKQEQFSNRVYGVLDDVVNRIEQINYAKFISNINAKLSNSGIIDNRGCNPYSSSIVDSLMYGSGFYRFQEEGSFMPKSNMIRYQIQQRGDYYTMFSDASKIHTTEMIFSQVVESALKKFDLTKSKSPEEFEKGKSSLERFIIQIFQESDISTLSTEDRLRDINVHNIIREYLIYNGISLTFSVELTDNNKADSLKRSRNRDDYFVINPFPNDWRQKKNMLVMHVQNRKKYLYASIYGLLIASGVCISILMIVFGYTVFYIIRQRKLSDIKNDFINNMTHEFKTPIATISLATSAINNEKVLNNPQQILKFNEMVRRENERMHKQVEIILNQARLDRKEIELDKQELNINDIVKEACNHFSLQCEEKKIELICSPTLGGCLINGDEIHIINCVINMIDNSIKYSKECPKIEVYTKITSKGAIIGVKDNGIGLSREAQKLVFKRFYRVTHGNLHDVKGFGLGLSYVKSIIEAHKGVIALKSKLNKGTTIELIFPKIK